MNVKDAEALLGELAESVSAAHVEVGVDGRAPNDLAFLKLTSPSDPEDYAILWTPGDGWFAVHVAGGFGTAEISEDDEDEEVREILARLLGVATAYIGGNWFRGKSRLFQIPFVTVQMGNETVTLRRALFGSRKK